MARATLPNGKKTKKLTAFEETQTMKNRRNLLIVLILSGLFVSCADAQTKRRKKQKNTNQNTQKPVIKEPTNTGDLKILATALMGNVEEPLIYVARDAATYESLKKMVPELPAANGIDFKKTAVVAAFLGTKPTAGFEVNFAKAANNSVKIEIVNKAPGSMVAQVLTTPFKVALVPTDEEKPLQLEIGAEWRNTMRIYRVSAGEFSFSGGFAPIQKRFNLEGTIGVWRFGDLITIDFKANGKGSEKTRKINEIASGVVSGNSILLNRIDAVNLIDPPHPALKATGTFGENQISLAFESLPTTYADGYEGKGNLTAIK